MRLNTHHGPEEIVRIVFGDASMVYDIGISTAIAETIGSDMNWVRREEQVLAALTLCSLANDDGGVGRGRGCRTRWWEILENSFTEWVCARVRAELWTEISA